MVTTIKITCDGVFIQSNSKLSPKSPTAIKSQKISPSSISSATGKDSKQLLTKTSSSSSIHVSSKLKANRYDLNAGDVYLCKQIVSKSCPISVSWRNSLRICRSNSSLTTKASAAARNKSLSHNQRHNNKRRSHHKLCHELFITNDNSDTPVARGGESKFFCRNSGITSSSTANVDVKKAKSCIELKRKSFPSKKLLESYCFYSETTTWDKQLSYQQQHQHHDQQQQQLQQLQLKKKVAVLSVPKNPDLFTAASFDC